MTVVVAVHEINIGMAALDEPAVRWLPVELSRRYGGSGVFWRL